MVERVISSLRKLIMNTEQVYSKIGGSYPRLMEEMKKNLSRTAGILKEFQSQSCGDGLVDNVMGGVVDQATTIIQEANVSFHALHDEDEKLFQELSRNMDNIGRLEENIFFIKEISENVQVVALNAMVVALKAGKDGGGFSYITQELKKLSEKTIDETFVLTEKGRDVQSIFNDFKNKMAAVRSLENEIFSNLSSNLHTSLENFKSGVDAIIEFLTEIKSESETVQNPLFSIMEEIQFQDIIRQSVDNVILSLKALEIDAGSQSQNDFLDELSFTMEIVDICISLLEDIDGKIKKSVSLFHEKVETVQSIIEDLGKKQKIFSITFLEGGAGSGQNLEILLNEATLVIQSLISKIDNSSELKVRVEGDIGKLIGEVKEIEARFQEFSKLTNRFNNITIASRIEAAKQTKLKGMDKTVEEMGQLHQGVSTSIEGTMAITKDLLRKTIPLTQAYGAVFKKEAAFAKEFETNIKQCYNQMHDLKDRIEQVISNYSAFSTQFFTLFNATREDLDELEILDKDIRGIIQELLEIKETAKKTEEGTLEKMHIPTWEIRNERLKNIIEKFTIYSHKEAASGISGVDLETERSKEGEITLF